MSLAALFHGSGQPFNFRRYDFPAPHAGEIVVRVRCCALCKSDLHTHAGRRTEPTPTVLGHEIVGTIASFGTNTNPHDARGTPCIVGDRITWAIVVGCGTCYFCANDLPQKCATLYKYGHQRVDEQRPFAGGLSDTVVLHPQTVWYRVPDRLPDDVAALANCSTATVAAVVRVAGPTQGRTVAVLGAGILGLTACAMLSTSAANIVAIDPDANARERALRFGATHAVAPHEAAARLQELTAHRGADVVLELAGTAQTVEQSFALPRIGGTIVLAGTVAPVGTIPLAPEMVVRRMLTLHGVHNYHPHDLGTALDFLAGPGQQFPFPSLIGATYPLTQLEAAFAAAHRQTGQRILVHCQETQ